MEVGWTTVETLDPDLIPLPVAGVPRRPVRPPPGSRLLARNELCVQAYAVGPHRAVQFHPEVDAPQLSRWLSEDARAEAERAGQDPDLLVAQTEAEEPYAAQRADHLVATALRLAEMEPAESRR